MASPAPVLPPDILYRVLDFFEIQSIDNKANLLKCCLVSRQMKDHSQRLLYSHVRLPHAQDCAELRDHLNVAPRLAKFVRSLCVSGNSTLEFLLNGRSPAFPELGECDIMANLLNLSHVHYDRCSWNHSSAPPSRFSQFGFTISSLRVSDMSVSHALFVEVMLTMPHLENLVIESLFLSDFQGDTLPDVAPIMARLKAQPIQLQELEFSWVPDLFQLVCSSLFDLSHLHTLNMYWTSNANYQDFSTDLDTLANLAHRSVRELIIQFAGNLDNIGMFRYAE